jgi:protocatechuate 3,4-dioxygenase beta subunit
MIRLLSIGLILSFALSPHFLFAQERDRIRVTGKVTDLKGEPLAGVSVQEKGNGNGTITNDHNKTGEYRKDTGKLQ